MFYITEGRKELYGCLKVIKKIIATELEYERKILHRDAEALNPGRAVPLDFIYKASQSVRNFKMITSEH